MQKSSVDREKLLNFFENGQMNFFYIVCLPLPAGCTRQFLATGSNNKQVDSVFNGLNAIVKQWVFLIMKMTSH